MCNWSIFALLLFAFSWGCPASNGDPHDQSAHGHEADAGHDDENGHNLNFESIVGLQTVSDAFTLTLTAADPDPAIKGKNNWQMLLEDTAGEKISDATIVIQPRMPQHNHGTIPATFEAAELSEPGTYEFIDVYLLMIGDWEITTTISANDINETLVFHVDATN